MYNSGEKHLPVLRIMSVLFFISSQEQNRYRSTYNYISCVPGVDGKIHPEGVMQQAVTRLAEKTARPISL